MKLLVLGRPILRDQVTYRGTYREQPFHFDDRPEDDEANGAFHLFMRSTEEGGPIDDLNTAFTVLQVYRRYAPERQFELVEVTSDECRPAVGEDLIGFDISAGCYYSLVAAAIAFTGQRGESSVFLPGVYVLGYILREHFREKLNAHGLFQHAQCARDCLDAMMALQRIQENLYENPEMSFEVVGVYTVRVR